MFSGVSLASVVSWYFGRIMVAGSAFKPRAITRFHTITQKFIRVGTCFKPSPVLGLTSRSTRTQPWVAASSTRHSHNQIFLLHSTVGSRSGRLTLFVRLPASGSLAMDIKRLVTSKIFKQSPLIFLIRRPRQGQLSVGVPRFYIRHSLLVAVT